MELRRDNVDAFIVQCITNAQATIHRDYTDENEEPSLIDETYSHEDLSYSANEYLFSSGEEVNDVQFPIYQMVKIVEKTCHCMIHLNNQTQVIWMTAMVVP
jgi:hypothetical protein